MNTEAGMKNGTGSMFLICFINGMVGRGHGRVVGPVNMVVSTLDTDFEEGEVLMNCTYQA
jgi:hypothetical protein